jgi:hypothetical protein
MKLSTNYRWLILIALLIIGAWFGISRQNAASRSEEDKRNQANGTLPPTSRTPGEPSTRSTARPRDAAKDPLAGVRSPLAKRYLRFMLPGARLDGESYDQSIVNNAFKEAWGVTARIDLTDEQQDRLAEFLLQEDWSKLITMDRAQVEKWAKEHLSDQQRAALLAFIEESKQGQRDLSELRMNLKQKEYGVGTPQEAFTAEMRDSARIAELLARNTDNLSDEEVEKMKAELKGLMKKNNAGQADADDDNLAKPYKDEHATQFFHLLADRIHLTEEQQLDIYDALRKGATPPTNPYDYQSRPEDQLEAHVRSNTAWMGKVLTPAQYENYLRHHLAEIEMIRFQTSRQ